MIGYIYLTTNDANGKIYVGKRQKPKVERYYKGSGKLLKLAINKYGKSKFHTTILERCDTEEELCNAERRWIEYYRRLGADMYNIADGGNGGNMVDWNSLAKERRLEINKKNSESHKGEKNAFFGKKHSDISKKLISANSARIYPEGLKEYKKRQRNNLPKIAQYEKHTGELIRIWDNWCEASKAVSPSNRCGYAHITECCRHKRKSAYGFRWEFAEEGWTV